MPGSNDALRAKIADLSNEERQAVRRIYQQVTGMKDFPTFTKAKPLATRALREWDRSQDPIDIPSPPPPAPLDRVLRPIGHYIAKKDSKECLLYGLPVKKGDFDLDLLEVDGRGQKPEHEHITYLLGLEDFRVRIIKVTADWDKIESKRTHEFNMNRGVALLQRFLKGDKKLDVTTGFIRPDLFSHIWDRRLDLAERTIKVIADQKDYKPLTTDELMRFK